jgi:hypothetical protein
MSKRQEGVFSQCMVFSLSNGKELPLAKIRKALREAGLD